jgi:hypothetical protein
MQRYRGREPLDFFDAVREEETRIAGAPPLEARRFAYLERGFYGRQLERVFKFFPREQMKVVKFEDFKKHQRQTLASIFSFLGRKPRRSRRNKDRNIVPYERAMNWEERVFLYNLFAEDISKLNNCWAGIAQIGNCDADCRVAALWLPDGKRRACPANSYLLEARLLSRIPSKQRFPTHDSRTLRFKKRAQFWCEK